MPTRKATRKHKDIQAKAVTRIRRIMGKPVRKIPVARPEMYWRGGTYRDDNGNRHLVLLIESESRHIWVENEVLT